MLYVDYLVDEFISAELLQVLRNILSLSSSILLVFASEEKTEVRANTAGWIPATNALIVSAKRLFACAAVVSGVKQNNVAVTVD